MAYPKPARCNYPYCISGLSNFLATRGPQGQHQQGPHTTRVAPVGAIIPPPPNLSDYKLPTALHGQVAFPHHCTAQLGSRLIAALCWRMPPSSPWLRAPTLHHTEVSSRSESQRRDGETGDSGCNSSQRTEKSDSHRLALCERCVAYRQPVGLAVGQP